MQVHKRNAAFFLLSVAIILVSTPVGAFQHPTRSVPRFATNPTKRFPIRYDGKASRAPTRAPFSSIDDSRKKASRVALFSTAMGPGGLHPMAWYSMSMLALQFGTQPILVRKFMPKSICRSTVVLAQEVAKVILGGILLWATGGWASSVAGWTIKESCLVAGFPALLYVVQNYCTLIAYQNLAPVTFNVLNQTKTLSAALCCYFVMGRIQSKLQIASLILLLMSALVIEKVIPLPFSKKGSNGESTNSSPDKTDAERKTHLLSGVVPILAASFISGLAGAFVQKLLQNHGRNSYLFTMELSVASALMVIVSLLFGSPDAKLIQKQGMSNGWTRKTWLPVLTNASGGIVVGLVTKHAGAVRKGFALIFGLLLSGVLQARFSADPENAGVTPEQIAGGALASLSLWMYAK